MTWELLPDTRLVTDDGDDVVIVKWAALEQHITELGQAKPGTAAGITAYQVGRKQPLAAVQLLALTEGKLAVEVNFSYGTRGSRYQRVKPAGSSARVQRLLVQPGWAVHIQKGAILTSSKALDAVAWACAEGSLHGSLHTMHVAEDFWADVAAGRRSPP